MPLPNLKLSCNRATTPRPTFLAHLICHNYVLCRSHLFRSQEADKRNLNADGDIVTWDMSKSKYKGRDGLWLSSLTDFTLVKTGGCKIKPRCV
jgi:hypothetical protein